MHLYCRGKHHVVFSFIYIFFLWLLCVMRQFVFTSTTTEPSRKILISSWRLRSGTFKTPILSWIGWLELILSIYCCVELGEVMMPGQSRISLLFVSDVPCDQFSLLNSVVSLVFFLVSVFCNHSDDCPISIRRSRMPIMI